MSNISLSDLANNVSEEQEEQQQGEDAMVVEDEQPKLDDEADEEDVDVADAELPPQPPTKDIFNLFSLAFACKSKDLSERRIRLEFGLVAEVWSPKTLAIQKLTITSGVSSPRPAWQG